MNVFQTILCVLCCLALWAGCNDEQKTAHTDGGLFDDAVHLDSSPTDSGGASEVLGTDGTVDGQADAQFCLREPQPADRDRRVVVSHPFDAQGDYTDVYAHWAMTAGGEITPGGATFSMGRSPLGRIVFTPDGNIGITAQDDGTLGVLEIDQSGAVNVVHAAFTGSFYAAGVVMDPAGQRAYVLDTQWRENGGGIYTVRIHCDGTLSDEGLVAPAKLPYAMAFVPDDSKRAIVVAKDIFDSPADTNVHLLDWSLSPVLIDSVDGFGDDEAIVSDAAMTADGSHILIGDNSGFSSVPNRVAVVELSSSTLTATQTITPLEDPIAIVTSPYNNSALVASGFGDALFVLAYDPNEPNTPFTLQGELSYNGAGPALPGKAVMLTRGSLTGLVFVAENLGVRQVQFNADGTLDDWGLTSGGSGSENVVGAVGVQP